MKNKSDRFFILTEEPGVGKSAIAAQLTNISNNDIKAYHFCRAGDEKPSDLVVYFGQERFSVTWTPVKIYVVNY